MLGAGIQDEHYMITALKQKMKPIAILIIVNGFGNTTLRHAIELEQ